MLLNVQAESTLQRVSGPGYPVMLVTMVTSSVYDYEYAPGSAVNSGCVQHYSEVNWRYIYVLKYTKHWSAVIDCRSCLLNFGLSRSSYGFFHVLLGFRDRSSPACTTCSESCSSLTVDAVLLLTEREKWDLCRVQETQAGFKLRRRSSTLRLSPSEAESHKARRIRVRPVETCSLAPRVHAYLWRVFLSGYCSASLRSKLGLCQTLAWHSRASSVH